MSLHQTLLNTTVYHKKLRPGRNQSEPTIVTMKMTLDNLVDIDEISGTVKITAKLEVSWIDDRIMWNPTHFNGIEKVLFQMGDIWVPDMYTMSSLASKPALGVEKFIVRYTHDGKALWEVSNMFWSTCDIRIVYYPVDTQSCQFIFSTSGYTSDDVQLKVLERRLVTDAYKDSSAWRLISAKAFVEKGTSSESDLFIGEVKYERRSTIYIVTVVVPPAVMGFVHLLVFFLPDDSGERVGFSVTVLLSLAVYQSMLSEALPKASRPQIPVLSVKIFVDLITSSLIQVCVVVSQYLYMKEQKREELPRVIKRFARCLLCMTRKRAVKAADDCFEDESKEGKNSKTLADITVDVYIVRRMFNITCGCYFFLATLATNIAIVCLFSDPAYFQD
ncbi:acetylcholine receptor subunit beta-type unc-29-like [Saccostrea echinata]|uniref:acetylcholine receptor subunit beta-type unc-29-like n=1 Tax=Saccostrea echinata TaxID=191078 RepID=UPI002A836CE5|nr:acetylcholine receptor subunit beta-type unc-29-like [Saccostrea echinata]